MSIVQSPTFRQKSKTFGECSSNRRTETGMTNPIHAGIERTNPTMKNIKEIVANMPLDCAANRISWQTWKIAAHLTSILLLLFLASPVRAETCRTVMLPESNNTGGSITVQPGSNYIIQYTPPAGARVGLEFWMHAFPGGAPENTQYLLVYLNYPSHGARRMFHAQNAGPEYGTGLPVNFPLSTWVHQGEWFVVNWLNNTDTPQGGYFIVTLRQCFP